MDAALRIDTLKNCKDWLAQLPLTNARQAHSLLLAQMKLLEAATAAIWNDVIALWFALMQGYQACADAGVMHLALIHQRAMRYSGLAMQDHNRIYRAPLKPEDVPRKIPASLIMAPTASRVAALRLKSFAVALSTAGMRLSPLPGAGGARLN